MWCCILACYCLFDELIISISCGQFLWNCNIVTTNLCAWKWAPTIRSKVIHKYLTCSRTPSLLIITVHNILSMLRQLFVCWTHYHTVQFCASKFYKFNACITCVFSLYFQRSNFHLHFLCFQSLPIIVNVKDLFNRGRLVLKIYHNWYICWKYLKDAINLHVNENYTEKQADQLDLINSQIKFARCWKLQNPPINKHQGLVLK